MPPYGCCTTHRCRPGPAAAATRSNTGVIDWTGAAQGDAMFDLASLTLGHPERLGDVAAGYGDVDVLGSRM